MPTLSLKKLFSAIAGVIILIHLGDIRRMLQPGYIWLGESLRGLNDFPEGAQTAIAICVLLLVVVVIFKIACSK